MKSLLSFLFIGCLASTLAAPADPVKVKWCAQSEAENKKCHKLMQEPDLKDKLTCVLKDGSDGCIRAIAAGEADAVTLDGGDIYKAGLENYKLHPIIAEDYSKESSETCYYAVAVAKAGTGFGLKDLKGKKSCHTGLGKSAGWNIPIGTLLSQGQIVWGGIDDEDIVKAVSEFFSESCVPGAAQYPQYKNLCKLCKVDCSRTHKETYYDYSGAFQCLQDIGDVAFVKHSTVPVADRSKYELLCKDGTRKPLDKYAECHLARVPAHAVVSRKDDDLAERIWKMLEVAKGFGLFSSDKYNSKNLLFKDATVNLVQLPKSIDSFLYLGAEYMSIIRSLQKEGSETKRKGLRWCTVGKEESVKCDDWSINSADEAGNAKIDCPNAPTVDDCIRKIMHKEADAMAVDGGEVYSAGKCGLVPAMVEQYDEAKCITPGDAPSYYAVAVVKKSSSFSWADLSGKKSCHTGMGRTAGWNVPMGLIHKDTKSCNLTEYFKASCAPGADPESKFCKLCVGDKQGVKGFKCKPSAEELYYGYAGAFRCLAEGAGDVAFVKHTIVTENTDGKGPSWAKDLKSEDYELLCYSGPRTRAPVSEYLSCHLAKVPAHAVVTRPEMQDQVASALEKQQELFGRSGSRADMFQMFQSGGKNLLFKDSTKCLQRVPVGKSVKDFLGPEYYDSVTSLRECSSSMSELEKACSSHTCQRKA